LYNCIEINTAAETRNANIFRTLTDMIESPTIFDYFGELKEAVSSYDHLSRYDIQITTTTDNRKWQHGRQNQKYISV